MRGFHSILSARNLLNQNLARLLLVAILAPLAPFIQSIWLPNALPLAHASTPGSISITKTGSDPYGAYSGNDSIDFNFPAGHGLNDGRSFTIETWAWLGNSNPYGMVTMTAGDPSDVRTHYWNVRRSGYMMNPTTGTWFAEGGGTAYCNPTALTNAMPMGQWVDLAFERSLVSGAATDSIYINGVLSGSCSVGTSNANDDTVRIGTTSGYSNSNTSYFGPTRIIDGEAIYSSNFTPSTSFASYSSNSSGTGTTILNLAPTSTSALNYAQTPPYAPTLSYGAVTTDSNPTSSIPTESSSSLSPPIYLSRTFAINSGSYNPSYSFAGTAPTLTATASAGSGSITFSSATPSVCTVVSSGAVSFLAPGTCTISAQIATDGTYLALTSTPISFAVTSSTATLSALTSSAGSLTPTFSATTTSYAESVPNSTTSITLTPTVTQVNATVKVNGTSVSSGVASSSIPLTIGSNSINVAVTAQDGITTQSYSVTVTRQQTSQNISTTSVAPTHAAVAGATYTTSATASSGLSVAISLDATSTGCTINTGVVSFISSGTCVIDFNQAGNSTYSAASQIQQSFTVGKGALTLAFGSAPSGLIFGESAGTHTVTAVATPLSTGTISYSSLTSATCSVDGTTGSLTVIAAGLCTIAANDSGTANYAAATQVSQNISIAKATPTLSGFAIPGQNFGGSPIVLTPPSVSGALVGSFAYASGNTSVATISGSTLTSVGGGTSVITSTFVPSDSTDYNSAQESATVVVGQSPQVITINTSAPATGSLGSATYTPSALAPGGSVAIALDSSSTGCSLAGGAITFTGTGLCVINFSQSGNSSYLAATPAQQSISVYGITCSIGGSFYVTSSTIPTAAGQHCSGVATIPVGITGVAIAAFAPNTSSTNRNLTGLVFPSSGFVNIDQGGFENLGLTSVTVPSTVTVVGQYAFENNPLVSATIQGAGSGSTTYLGESVFANKVYGLGSGGTGIPLALTFGSGNIQVGDNFGSATNFASVNFGSGLSTIGVNAFKQNGISNWVPVIPATITTISANAFTYSPSMKVIEFGSSTTLNLTYIDPSAFDVGSLTSVQDCEVSGSTTVLHTYLATYQPNAVIWCDPVVASAPISLSGTASSGQASLTWSSGVSHNEPPVTDFLIQYRVNGTSLWNAFAHAASTSGAINVTGLSNGLTYDFQVAAINLIGVSPFSNVTDVRPLGLSFTPVFGSAISTPDGFTVDVTNFDPTYVWESATVTTGSGTISIGTAAGGLLPLTISGMSPGSIATISITAAKENYSDGIGYGSGSALKAALTPAISNVVANTGGFTATITDYDSNFSWSVHASPGNAAISNNQIVVTGVNPVTQVVLSVTSTRSGYASGLESMTATTLQLLQIHYDPNGATGGSCAVDSHNYNSNATAVILGNSAQSGLSLSGYSFSGWTLNSDGSGHIYQAGDSFQLSSSSITFYAKWTPVPYTVTYQANGASSGAVPTDNSTYSIGQNAPVYGNSGNLARMGYAFAGWGYNATETNTVYSSGATYLIGASNVVLWAIWSPNTYSVTYDANGAGGLPSKTSDTYTTGTDPAALPTVGTMVKRGYVFAGWAVTVSGNPLSGPISVADNTKLYAQWNLANYPVSYTLGANGSGAIPLQANVNFGAPFTVATSNGISSTDSSQNTYAFVAWSDGVNTYAPGQSYVMKDAPVTLSALWTRIYNVTYSFNGGSVSVPIPDAQKVSGDTITVTSTTPVRDGYTFTYWLDQSGQSASNGETYTVSDNHYLFYAQWMANSYTITYDVNGGSSVPVEPNHTIGEIFTLPSAPTRTGYDFASWSDGSASYNAGAPYQIGDHSVVLQAQWVAQQYAISFDFNGGIGTPIVPIVYTFGNLATTLPASGPSRTDFTFSGWSSSPTSTSGLYSLAPSGNILLHAVWISSVYHLTFNAGDGLSDTSTAKVTIGQSIVMPGATRPNYTLEGWSTQNSGGNLINSATSFTPNSDVTLFAQWTLQTFTVTFNGNGGTPAESSAGMTFGSSTPIVLPNAVRNSYVFGGWYSDPSAGYLIGAAGASYSPTSSLSAYAHWIQGSLAGIGPATQIAQVTVHAGYDSAFTAGTNGSTATVNYVADSLPDGTLLTAFLENTTTRVAPLLSTTATPILSLVLAWIAPDGTVPDTVAGKPLVLTVANPNISIGSKVYGLIGNNPSLLGTATINGQVQVSISQDPDVVVAQVAPDAPTNVVAQGTSSTSATVSWNAPASNGGSTVTSYVATSNLGSSCTSTTTTCMVSGLTSGIPITFSVIATNAIGNSASSPTSTAITLTLPPVIVTSPPVAPVIATAPSGIPTQPVVPVMPQAATTNGAPEVGPNPTPTPIVVPTPVITPVPTQDPVKVGDGQITQDATHLAMTDASKAAIAVVPAISIYSISRNLQLSKFDMAYLKAYVSTLKPHAQVVCIGYTYTRFASLVSATALAKKQALALCAIIKRDRPILHTSIAILPASKAPLAASGAKWVAVSYRVDGYQTSMIKQKAKSTVKN